MSWHKLYPSAGGPGEPAQVLQFRPMTPDISNWIPMGTYGYFVSEGTNVQHAPFGTWWFTAYSSSVGPNYLLWITAVHHDTVLEMNLGVSGGTRDWTHATWRSTGRTPSEFLSDWTQTRENFVPRSLAPTGAVHVPPPVFTGGYFGTSLRTYFMRTNWSGSGSGNVVLTNYARNYTFNLPAGVAWMSAEEDAPISPQFTVRYSTNTAHPGINTYNLPNAVPQKVAYCYHTGPEAQLSVTGTGYMIRQPLWRT